MTRQIHILFFFISYLTYNSYAQTSKYVQTYYNIDQVKIRTICTKNQDTLCKNNYENKYNLPGRHCVVFIDTNNTQINDRIGISFKIDGKPFTFEKGKALKGDPKKDTAEFITDIKISFLDFETGQKFLLNNYLKADTAYEKYLFKNWWVSIATSSSDGCCRVGGHFESIDKIIELLNHSTTTMGTVSLHAFIFWIDKAFLESLKCTPDIIVIEVETINKRTKNVSRIIDEYKINGR